MSGKGIKKDLATKLEASVRTLPEAEKIFFSVAATIFLPRPHNLHVIQKGIVY